MYTVWYCGEQASLYTDGKLSAFMLAYDNQVEWIVDYARRLAEKMSYSHWLIIAVNDTDPIIRLRGCK